MSVLKIKTIIPCSATQASACCISEFFQNFFLHQQVSIVLHPRSVCCVMDLILLHKHWMLYKVEGIYPVSTNVGILSFESMLFPISVSYKVLSFFGSNGRQISTFNNVFWETTSMARNCFFRVKSLTYLFVVELKACSVHPS